MLFEKLCTDKGLANATKASYFSALKHYQELNGMTLEELLEEADREEEEGIRWKRRKLRERLIEYRNYLYANKGESTAKKYLTTVKTFYIHFEIEIQKLPSFNSNQIDKTYKMTHKDLLTKEELIDAYYEANNLTKCMIVFGISTGLSKTDMLNLTVGDFIVACQDYLTETELLNQLLELKKQDNVIPCFEGNRQKTDSRYVTFCSPEATSHIVQYLLGLNAKLQDEGKELSPDHKIFNISPGWVSRVFQRINNKLNLGKVGKYVKFRCHQLRKFHASTLLNSEIVTWTIEEIDTLQGRSMDKTHQAYFHNSTDKLFKKYYDCVDELMLFQSIHEIDKDAYDKLEQENNFYKQEVIKNEKKLEEQSEIIQRIQENQRELEALLKIEQ